MGIRPGTRGRKGFMEGFYTGCLAKKRGRAAARGEAPHSRRLSRLRLGRSYISRQVVMRLQTGGIIGPPRQPSTISPWLIPALKLVPLPHPWPMPAPVPVPW